MKENILLEFIIYLGAAVVFVPIAKRLNLGSVLGYLLAGIMIGPFVMGFIGQEGKALMHFAEFGVVMMLFLIGLELEPQKLWKIRNQILGVGLAQVAVTSLLFFIACLLLNLPWQSALAIGLTLSMSSTALVLQSLKEKELMNTTAGQGSFAVLLFQDISVIPILAVLPLLVFIEVQETGNESHNLIDQLPGWLQSISILGAVATVISLGRYGVVPLLRIVANTRQRELFTASSLLIVVAIAFLMELVGLSPALGTFLAGVVLANSEFKHELESDLEPFKGLLLGLFFMAVGASINFTLIMNDPVIFLLLTLGIMAGKSIVLFFIGKIFNYSNEQNSIFSSGLSQVGEFAFVLFSMIAGLKIITSQQAETMIAVTAMSMAISPLIILINEKMIMKRFNVKSAIEREPDSIDEKHKVIIAGFSHFGSTVGRFLRANGIEATILDNNSEQVELLRKMGFKVYYGDATRLDLLESAGAHEAKILIVAINNPEINLQLTETVKKHFPNLQLMVRSRNRYDAYELMDSGVKNIYREHLDTSIRLGVDVLISLGFRSYSATRSGQNFRKYDEEAMEKLFKNRNNQKEYISNVREQIALQEELLKSDMQQSPSDNDHAWDSDFMRETIKNLNGTSEKK